MRSTVPGKYSLIFKIKRFVYTYSAVLVTKMCLFVLRGTLVLFNFVFKMLLSQSFMLKASLRGLPELIFGDLSFGKKPIFLKDKIFRF